MKMINTSWMTRTEDAKQTQLAESVHCERRASVNRKVRKVSPTRAFSVLIPTEIVTLEHDEDDY